MTNFHHIVQSLRVIDLSARLHYGLRCYRAVFSCPVCTTTSPARSFKYLVTNIHHIEAMCKACESLTSAQGQGHTLGTICCIKTPSEEFLPLLNDRHTWHTHARTHTHAYARTHTHTCICTQAHTHTQCCCKYV